MSNARQLLQVLAKSSPWRKPHLLQEELLYYSFLEEVKRELEL